VVSHDQTDGANRANCQPEAPSGTKEKYMNFGGYDCYRENFFDVVWNKGIETLGFFKIPINRQFHINFGGKRT
jgi:hypothetical protein